MAFRRRRPMRTSKQSPGESNLRDRCQTPAYALRPLVESGWLRAAFMAGSWRKKDEHKTIWEPAAGEGILARSLRTLGYRVITSDILTALSVQPLNFLTDEPAPCSLIVTNPPYSLAYKFLERCFSLKHPFALLMPISVLGTQRASRLFDDHGPVRILVPRQRINFKMPNLGWAGRGAHFSTAWFCWNPAAPDFKQLDATGQLDWYDVNPTDGLEDLCAHW